MLGGGGDQSRRPMRFIRLIRLKPSVLWFRQLLIVLTLAVRVNRLNQSRLADASRWFSARRNKLRSSLSNLAYISMVSFCADAPLLTA